MMAGILSISLLLAAAEGSPAGEPPQETGPTTLRVAAVQFETTNEVEHNLARILAYLHEAAEAGARVVVFSELALTGYSKKAAFGKSLEWETIDDAMQRIQSACAERGLYAVVGCPTRDSGACYCSAVTVGPDGQIVDTYEKIYRAGEAWASPGRRLSLFLIDGIRCACIICHDERYAPLVQLRALAGAQLFFYISCESGIGSESKWGPYRAQIQARAVENQVYVVHANAPASRIEPPPEGASHGESRIIARDGNILQEAPVYGDRMLIQDLAIDPTKAGGLRKALSDGPLAPWMREGLGLVIGPAMPIE